MSDELIVPEREPEAGPWETHIPAADWEAISLCRQHRGRLGIGNGVPFLAPHLLAHRRPAICPAQCPCGGRACKDGLVGDGWRPKSADHSGQLSGLVSETSS